MAIEQVSIREMEGTVERYIFEQKNIVVNIDIQGHANRFGRQDMKFAVLRSQLFKLNLAYNIAKTYFDDQR